MELLPWQKWFLIHALELHPTERDWSGQPLFRFRKVLLLVGRQNGKSTVMQALTLWRLYIDRCGLVIGTAQDLEVAEALWAECVEIAQEIPELAAEIPKGGVYKGTGKKQLRLVTGETYKVKAATRRGGRGLSGDLVLLDELREHQTWQAWSAVTKTTNARDRAQVYGISNAGDASSVVLRHFRTRAHLALGNPDALDVLDEQPPEDLDDDAVDVDDLGIFEWSAAPGARISDRDAWAQANPSLGYFIRESTLAGDAANDPEWVFRTEVLCQWSEGALEGPFPPGSWEDGVYTEDPAPVPPPGIPKGERFAFAVDVAWDRSSSHVAVAGRRPDGTLHVEVVASRPGTDWVKPWLRERLHDPDLVAITAQAKGAPVSSLVPDLTAMLEDAEDSSVVFLPWEGSDLGRACGDLYDLVRSGALRHSPQPVLDVAAAVAVGKPAGDAWIWDRRKSPADIAPLVAITAAAWALDAAPEPETPFRSAYEDNDLMVV